MNGAISGGLQILGFCFLVAFFVDYYADRKGLEYSNFITKGSKMYKDENGVPHIQAESLQDAFFTEGFVHAEDRLWQMFFSYIVGTGRVSELFGKDALPLDKFSRLLNLKEVCSSALKTLTQEELDVLKSYSEGINHYIQTAKILPFEFVLFGIDKTFLKWEPVTSCVVTQLVQYYLSYDFYQELLRSFFYENKILDKDVIEKIFPFKHDQFEYTRTIVKGDEMPTFRKEKKIQMDNKNIKINEEVAPVKAQEIPKKKKTSKKNSRKKDKGNVVEASDVNKYLNKESGVGSNSFVISGKHTENGHPYLCNDPHLQNAIPAVWYFINIMIKSKTKNGQLIGASIPGVPSVFIGTNSHVTWGITNGMVDAADIIRIEKSKFDHNLSLRFSSQDKTPHLNLVKRKETFYINKEKSESVEIEFYDSEIGPVLNGHSLSLFIVSGKEIPQEVFDEDKYYYIIRASILGNNDSTLKFFANILDIESNESFKKHLPLLSLSLNIVYSDRYDNIGYQLTGKIPIKTTEEEGAYIKTVTKPEDLNLEYIPFEELPHLENPERGYIVTSNNLVIDVDYKHRIHGGFILDSRAIAIENGIENLIKSGKKINAQLINEHLLKNVKDDYCLDILKWIYEVLKKDNFISSLEQPKYTLLKNLFSFDCDMKGESMDALLFNVWEEEFHHNLHYTHQIENFITQSRARVIEAEERANYLIYKLKQYIKDPSLCLSEYRMTCSEFFLKNFDNAIELIETKLGKDMKEWKWKEINIKHFPHKPFSLIPGLKMLAHRTVKTDGNSRTPKISFCRKADKSLESKISSNFKFIINLNDLKNQTYFSIDTGQSGRIFHRHYDDMMENHEKGILIKFDPVIKEDKFTLEFVRPINK